MLSCRPLLGGSDGDGFGFIALLLDDTVVIAGASSETLYDQKLMQVREG